MSERPVVGISCCLRDLAFGDYPPTGHHVVFHKYVDYVIHRVRALPILIPAIPEIASDLDDFLSRLDGVLLTGSPSNVGVRTGVNGVIEKIVPLGTADYARDITTSRLIRSCVATSVPVLGICRGMQEINVCLGGNLHDELHKVPGHLDHRSNKSLPYQERYAVGHPIDLISDSWLEYLLRSHRTHEKRLHVNSLHGQGVSQLGQGVVPQALAEDGVIEAIRVETAPAFTVGVQWHIEWAAEDSVLDAGITRAFQNACAERRAGRARRSMT
jgi:putative glutamine amidotransferase